jgi:hypothetical protein
VRCAGWVSAASGDTGVGLGRVVGTAISSAEPVATAAGADDEKKKEKNEEK